MTTVSFLCVYSSLTILPCLSQVKDNDRIQTLGSLSIPLSRLLSGPNLSLDQWFQLDKSGPASRIYINTVLRVRTGASSQSQPTGWCTSKNKLLSLACLLYYSIYLIIFLSLSFSLSFFLSFFSGVMVRWGKHPHFLYRSSQPRSRSLKDPPPTDLPRPQLCHRGK